MYPDGERQRLPSVTHQSDLSSDLQHLTLDNAAGKHPYSENVADRNIQQREPRANGYLPPNVKPLVPKFDRFSEDVANWNMVQNEKPTGSLRDLPPPLKVKKRASMDSRPDSTGYPISPTSSHGSHGLARKPDFPDLRHSSDVARSQSPPLPTRNIRRSLEVPGSGSNRLSLDKPLPPRPSMEYARELENDPVVRREPGNERHLEAQRALLADKNIDLTGVVNLSNTEDTTLHERWAPAVTHETIRQDVHHIREERITREIHNHHVFHRVLPIIDIEVLPARHFVPVQGGYAEIAEDEVPGRAGPNAQWLIAETVSKLLPESKGPILPNRFTARTFEGEEGDYKESTAPEGFKRTEQWWVHPPTFYEPHAVASGQTYPFYLGSPDPRDDGLRATLPKGQVIGVSPLLAKQRREQMGDGVQQEAGAQGPPVPPHKIFPADMVDAARAGPNVGAK